MKKKHSDSQKCIYFEDAVYFVTCKTKGNYPFFKEQISCAINRITAPEGATTSSHLRGYNELRLRGLYNGKYDILQFQQQFHQKHLNQNPHSYFRWQKSYHDHYIRNDSDFDEYWTYTEWNPTKHKMPDDWLYVFANPKYYNLTDQIEL